jgi:hypothetical protein
MDCIQRNSAQSLYSFFLFRIKKINKGVVLFIFYLFFNFYLHPLKDSSIRLSRGRGSSLDEVNLQILLEIEVGEDLILANLKELGKLGIRIDLSAGYLVLQLVGSDVGVDLLTDLNTGHHGASLLAEELDELVTDDRGLNKSGGLSVGVRSLLASLGLGSVLEFARNRLLKDLVVSLHGGQDGSDLLDLGTEVRQLGREGGGISSSYLLLSGSGNRGLDNRGRGGGSSSLGLSLLLLSSSSRSGGGRD